MRLLAILLTLACSGVVAQSLDHWTLAQNSHFEVYSQTTDKTAQNVLQWFEELRSFFRQNALFAAALHDQSGPALRVIGFRSEKDYAEYRIRPLADAYYASDGKRDYIVMAIMRQTEFGVAAHEYAHYVLHANSLKLPSCIQEGLAEYFSTLRVRDDGYEIGGDLPARTQTMQRNKKNWLPLAELLTVTADSTPFRDRKLAEIFYAESWSLVDMLMGSAAYSARFPKFVAESTAGSTGAQLFSSVYGKSLDEVASDLENWVRDEHAPRKLLTRAISSEATEVAALSDVQSQSLLAQLMLVSGHLEQAKSRYLDLSRAQPDNPDFPAALGDIAQRQGHSREALKLWQEAIEKKVQDPELHFRYALRAEESGADITEVKAALAQAVLLAPEFDDARYKLALLQYRSGDYQAAVAQLRAMHAPSEARRFAYWIALASALLELNEHEQAKAAAEEASKAAQTSDQKMAAQHTALMAATDLTVQFATDAEGHSQMITARVPHGTTDWNPFIEPSDEMRHANGKLSEVLCSKGKLTGFVLRTSSETITVDVPDPLHVLIRNSPGEFFCGPIQAKAADANYIDADYAVVRATGKTKNVLRGMTFLSK